MPEFENFSLEAARIAREIERDLIALEIDWQDESALRELAREAIAIKGGLRELKNEGDDPWQHRARVEVYGLISLMLQTMTESAELGYEVHGSDCWKALARALWAEKEASASPPVSRGTS